MSNALKFIREDLAIPETDLITLAGTDAGLHPSLEPLAGFWERGDLAAMQAIGLPEQSPTRADEIWRLAP